MKKSMMRSTLVLISTCVLTACGTTGAASVKDLRKIVGTDLVGVRGATPEDQRKINRTVVGICAAQVWTKPECAAHGEAIKDK